MVKRLSVFALVLLVLAVLPKDVTAQITVDPSSDWSSSPAEIPVSGLRGVLFDPLDPGRVYFYRRGDFQKAYRSTIPGPPEEVHNSFGTIGGKSARTLGVLGKWLFVTKNTTTTDTIYRAEIGGTVRTSSDFLVPGDEDSRGLAIIPAGFDSSGYPFLAGRAGILVDHETSRLWVLEDSPSISPTVLTSGPVNFTDPTDVAFGNAWNGCGIYVSSRSGATSTIWTLDSSGSLSVHTDGLSLNVIGLVSDPATGDLFLLHRPGTGSGQVYRLCHTSQSPPVYSQVASGSGTGQNDGSFGGIDMSADGMARHRGRC